MSGLNIPERPVSQAAPLLVGAVKVTAKTAAISQSKVLSDEALAQISKLKASDAKVRQHEQAHLAASAGLAVSNASFTYQKGPDGVNYAVAGEVRIDASPGRTPEETLVRAELIRQAALAPADPSAADRGVAAFAQQMAMQARAEMLQHANSATVQQVDFFSAVARGYDASNPDAGNIDTYA